MFPINHRAFRPQFWKRRPWWKFPLRKDPWAECGVAEVEALQEEIWVRTVWYPGSNLALVWVKVIKVFSVLLWAPKNRLVLLSTSFSLILLLIHWPSIFQYVIWIDAQNVREQSKWNIIMFESFSSVHSLFYSQSRSKMKREWRLKSNQLGVEDTSMRKEPTVSKLLREIVLHHLRPNQARMPCLNWLSGWFWTSTCRWPFRISK